MGFEILILGAALIAMIWFMQRSSRKRVEQMENERRQMREQLKAGVWVKTSSGFYGQFIELDGDVLVLAHPGGEETLWDVSVIASIQEPPFEAVKDAASEHDEDAEDKPTDDDALERVEESDEAPAKTESEKKEP